MNCSGFACVNLGFSILGRILNVNSYFAVSVFIRNYAPVHYLHFWHFTGLVSVYQHYTNPGVASPVLSRERNGQHSGDILPTCWKPEAFCWHTAGL